MIQIKYPSAGKDLDEFHKQFRKAINDNINKRAEIEAFLNTIDYIGNPLNLDILLTAGIKELIDLIPLIKVALAPLLAGERESLKNLFAYEDLQSDIAAFFMKMDRKKHINLCSCFFCNIDYINVINDVGQYKNKVDFLNNAQDVEFELIDGISEKTIEKIKAARPIADISLTFLTEAKRLLITKYSLNKANRSKNHFTLDHFLPKSIHFCFALSLYNLIPCCYSCNSKFKGRQEFDINAGTAVLSPTSPDFILEKNPLFKLYFKKGKDKDSTKELKDIAMDYGGFTNGERRFLEIFALQGRYEFHKKEALNMILKRQAYPDSAVKEIAKALKYTRDEESIKKDIFGSSLFNPAENNLPLAKFKKDIAEKIGIIPPV